MGTSAPRWTVVVPLYNKEAHIEVTLRSVLDQAGDDLEIVVVDDGSQDQGPMRVAAINDDRVRLVRQDNAGVSAARNRGIRESRGEWVAFLDADDLLHPQALTAYQYLMIHFPDAQVIAGAYVRVRNAEVPSYRFTSHDREWEPRLITNLPQTFLISGMPFCSSSIALRRDFLMRMSPWFPEGESMGEDLDLWLRAAERAHVAYSPVVLALYRVGLSESLMGSYRALDLVPVWQRLRQRALAGEMPAALRASSLRLAAEMEVTLARRIAKAGHWRRAWRHLLTARTAAHGHRWWVTLLVLTTGSDALVRRLR